MMQYAMELIARARQDELLREADAQRLSRGAVVRDRRVPHPPTRLAPPSRRSTR